ncbi:MAG: DNA topoisomerase I [Fervidicoccaceae archaeon]
MKRGSAKRGRCAPPSGFTLLIAEKTKAARALALALLERPVECRLGGAPYWVGATDEEVAVVAPAAGHLFELHTEARGYPVLEYSWVPRWSVDREARHTRRFLELMEWLSRLGPSKLVNACDYDVEGSVIGYLVIVNVMRRRDYRRMKFSSLTPEELTRAYRSLTGPDVEMVEAGLCRHELDWLWGVNLSRLLMDIHKKATGRRLVLSVGRVQTPTLVEAVDRFVEVASEIAMPIYRAMVVAARRSGERVECVVEGSPFRTRAEAVERVERIREVGRGIVKEVREEVLRLDPPPPFNLGDLQAEAYRLMGLSPYVTQKIAEELYLEGLITYPRTDSQRYPPGADHERILRSLSSFGYADCVEPILGRGRPPKPVEGKRTDPAHPAVFPTGLRPRRLSKLQERLYDLIARRYIATFMRSAVLLKTDAVVSFDGVEVRCSGVKVVEPGWTECYPREPREKPLPPLERGEELTLVRASVRRESERRRRGHTRASLLSWMELSGIGTESTRAPIIETLFKRGYVVEDGKEVKPTRLGLEIYELTKRYFPKLADVNLTREFEEMLRRVRERAETRERVLDEARRTVVKLIEEVRGKIEEAISLISSYEVTPRDKKCAVCELPSDGGLCFIHRRALESLSSSLSELVERLGVGPIKAVAWVAESKSHGSAAREVAKGILSGAIKFEIRQ